MIHGGFCRSTCGRCQCDEIGEALKIPAGCNCTDTTPPTSKFSCDNQVCQGFNNYPAWGESAAVDV